MRATPQSIIAALQEVPFFASLREEELADLSHEMIPRRYSAGQIVFHLGDPGGLLYIIESGKVKIYYPGVEGQEVVLAILGKGDFFGELALFDDEPRSATVQALENTSTYTLHSEALIQYIRKNPEVALGMLSAMADHIRSMNEQLSDVFYLDLPARLARKLLQLADDHGLATESGTTITLTLTQTDLAEMTGATRVSINKALRRFRKAGWVAIDDRLLVIKDRAALEEVIRLAGGTS